MIVLCAVGVLTCLDQIPVISALSDSDTPINPIRLVATASAETDADCPAVNKQVPAGPLAEFATRALVLVGTDCALIPMIEWIAELYGFAKPGYQPPHVKMRGISGKNSRGEEAMRGFQICLVCDDSPMIFTDGTDMEVRVYLTYPDGTVKMVYDKTKGGPAVPVPYNAEVKVDFDRQVRFWEKQLRVE